MRMGTIARLGGIAIALTVGATPAHAAPATGCKAKQEAAARRLARIAGQHFSRQAYAKARPLYRAALEACPGRPSLVVMLAQTNELLGELEPAIVGYRAYLQAVPGARDRREIETRLNRCLGKVRLSVRITSYPPGAAVFVDGRAGGVRGRTPITLSLRPGVRPVRVELERFVPAEQRVTIGAGADNAIDFPLKQVAELEIETRPPTARVAFAAETQSAPAPVRREVAPGLHKIRVTAPGYRTARRNIDVVGGQRRTVSVVLERLPRPGTLRVIADPPRAEVIVDGSPKARATPADIALLEGKHHVTVRGRNDRIHQTIVEVKPDFATIVHVELGVRRSTLDRGLLIGGASLSAAALITGAVLGGVTLAAQRDYDAAPTPDGQSRGQALALGTDALLISGGITAIATGLYWLFTLERPARSVVSTAPAPTSRHARTTP